MTTKKLLLAITALLLSTVAMAYGEKIGDLYYSLDTENQTACVVNGSGVFDVDDVRVLYYSGDITIPETVTYQGIVYTVTSIEGGHSIEERGFMPYNTKSFEDSKITSIRIPKTITTIEPYTFINCRDLTTIIFDGDVTSIGDGAFYGTGFTSFTIPNTVTSVGDWVLSNCKNLVSVTFHCKEIKDWLSYNEFIKEIIIGDEVESIGGRAFEGCSGLTSVTISESVTSIGDLAFHGCKGLTYITIPESVTFIGLGAFSNIDKLTDFVCYAYMVPKADVTSFENSYIDYVTLHVPAGSVDKYKAIEPWKGFKEIVPIDDPTIIAHIHSVESQKASYNLNGINVTKTNKTAKGIVIREGKKYYIR